MSQNSPSPDSRCRARPFLAQWEFEHINVVARAKREQHARLLAAQCRADAAKAGINTWALEIVAGGDLVGNLIAALNDAEFKPISRDQRGDGDGDLV